MPRFDELAPDQRAVLQLLLKQGKSYDDIAGLLRLDRSSVRERALDALDALGADAPGAADLPQLRQDELADHLLRQQPAAERPATQAFLETSAPGRAWARAVAVELRPLAGDALPAVPADPAAVDPVPAPRPAGAGATTEGALRSPGTAGQSRPRSSKLGGILVLAFVAAVVALGLVLVLRKGDDSSSAASIPASTPAAATGTSGATGAAAALGDQQINLKAPKGAAGKALGFALIQQGALAFQAQGLAAGDIYVVWLWNSASDALPLGLAKYIVKSKRVAGTLQSLPEEAVKYRTLVITRQPSAKTTTPGPVVLSGPLQRG